LHELTPGQIADFFALLVGRSKGITREGRPYYSCQFRDAKRTASCMVWGNSTWYEACERQWCDGQFYLIRGLYAEHDKYGGQIDIYDIRPVTEDDRREGFDPADFTEHSRYDSGALLTELKELAGQIGDLPLRRLVLTLVERHAEPLQRLPATVNKFYCFYGGLLEHTVSVTRICRHLAGQYAAHYLELRPPLNCDLVSAGAILHDFGRLLELDADRLPAAPTVRGRLLGHVLLTRDLVRDTARELGDLNPELVQLLEHIIVAHLNLPDWGSPRSPLIPEALILHHADDLDARLEMYVRCLSRDQATGPFTHRDPVLKRHLFKGRTV